VIAKTVRKISFWIGVASAAAIPLVPVVYRWMHPSKEIKVEEGVIGLMSWGLDMLGAMGEGITVMLWMSGFAAATALASLVAFIAAWLARDSRRTKWLCGLPVLLLAIIYGALVAMEA
jgi:hypothetical protein